MIKYILDTLFTVYTFLLFVRIIGSWFPSFQRTRVMRFVALYTDPYLNLFRRWIPPLGMMDLSPLVALFSLQIIEWVLLAIL